MVHSMVEEQGNGLSSGAFEQRLGPVTPIGEPVNGRKGVGEAVVPKKPCSLCCSYRRPITGIGNFGKMLLPSPRDGG